MKKILIVWLGLVVTALMAADNGVAPKPYGAVPSAAQLRWHEDEIISLVHFSTITYADKEWGYGDEPAALFNPSEFDARQIVKSAKDAGVKLLLLVTKHHGGFCLWPSKYNDTYTVKNSPWRGGKGDMVKELVDACRAEGLKVGLYLSPWDRNHKDYGMPEYVTYFHNQLRELLTNYGAIHEVWFDGANGGDGWYGGAKCTRRIEAEKYYQWDKVMAIVRELQPAAVCFGREDIRWVGNENGNAADPCWATLNGDGYGSGVRGGSTWMPAEADFPQRNGWFWHPNEQTKSPADLLGRYFASAGRNTVMNIGIAPDRRGLICAEDAAALKGFGERVRDIFATNLASTAKITASNSRPGLPPANLIDAKPATYWASDDDVLTPSVTLDFSKPVTFSVISLREYIQLGHRIDDWALDTWDGGAWKEFAAGTCIGAHRLWRGQPLTSGKIRLRITKAAACPALAEFGVYLEPEASRRDAGKALANPIETGLARTGWKVVSASCKGDGELVGNAIDGNPRTLWSTHDKEGHHSPPQEVVVDMGESHELSGFLYLPRQDSITAGNVDRYAFYVSADGTSWSDAAAKGEFSNILANPVQQKVSFTKPATGRYFKFVALHSADAPFVTVAELGVVAAK